MERVKGIEPSYSAWEAAALPLSYTRALPPMARSRRQKQQPPYGGITLAHQAPFRLTQAPVSRQVPPDRPHESHCLVPALWLKRAPAHVACRFSSVGRAHHS